MEDKIDELMTAIQLQGIEKLIPVLETIVNQQYIKPSKTGLINQTELREDLHISQPTIDRWKKHGLRPYVPPVKGSKTIFYKISDVLLFMGVG
ncbi:hypothetical protein JavanS250_0009 [Streptococcus satellite phage Javan250]|uniref:transcriptional regulator n=1 Tax=Streptococcus halotolerans TaxID=1814128 RepID=UPI000B08C1BF|nr:transcriptional regulator [Streptococcus halotolerans]QBX08342.1 hypothetical protein JavanS250_0009 [Streptococcus satellite phage Javan250]